MSNDRLSLRLWLGLLVTVIAATAFAKTMSEEQFVQALRAELKKSGQPSDSIGALVKVTNYGEVGESFWLAPVLRDGKVVAIYRDDVARNSVTLVGTASTLRSIRPELFSLAGVRQELTDRGILGGEPLLICVGPMSLFGSTNAGWFIPADEGFYLLSFEGRLASDEDVGRYWPTRMPALKQVLQSIDRSREQ